MLLLRCIDQPAQHLLGQADRGPVSSNNQPRNAGSRFISLIGSGPEEVV